MTDKQIILVLDDDEEVGELVRRGGSDGIPMLRDDRCNDVPGEARGQYNSHSVGSFDARDGWY
jgi:hypothetical protein